jgi:AcrR family transcriptional regulator
VTAKKSDDSRSGTAPAGTSPGSARAWARTGRARSARHGLVEERIYEQAARLFAERGYAGTTPQDIADAVGVSRQALYYYVKSKEEILAGLVSRMTTGAVSEMTRIVAQGLDSKETLREVCRHLATDRALNRTGFRLLDRSESALPPDLAKAFLDGRRQVLSMIVNVIEKGIADGWFHSRDPRVSALSVLGMCNWVAWWFEPGPGHPVEPIAEQIADSAVAMLSTPDAVGASGPPDGAAAVIDAIEVQLSRLRALVADPDQTDSCAKLLTSQTDQA